MHVNWAWKTNWITSAYSNFLWSKITMWITKLSKTRKSRGVFWQDGKKWQETSWKRKVKYMKNKCANIYYTGQHKILLVSAIDGTPLKIFSKSQPYIMTKILSFNSSICTNPLSNQIPKFTWHSLISYIIPAGKF